MAGEVYADGGVLQNIPVEPAVRVGARKVIAILAVPLSGRTDHRKYLSMNMVGIFLRTSAGIAFAERQLDDISTPLPPGVVLQLVEPLVDIVGPFEVSPGLMRIDMEYGWLRAADVLVELDPESRQIASAATTTLVTARVRAWHLEERVRARGPISGGEVRELRELKGRVRETARRRGSLGLPMPPQASRWWDGREVHDLPTPRAADLSEHRMPEEQLAGGVHERDARGAAGVGMPGDGLCT